MAVDAFLDLDTIKGDSTDDKHKNKIEVLAWSWGLSQSGSMHAGVAGGSHGKVSVQDISFTHYVDKASPVLVQYVASGTALKGKDKVILTLCKAVGKDSRVDYLVIKLSEVIVTSVSLGGSQGEDRITENVTLNFQGFRYIYQPLGDGKGAVEFAYDISTNKTM